MKTQELRRYLEEIRRKRVNQAIRSLLIDDDVEVAKRHLAWAETAEHAVRAAAPGARQPIYLTGIILLVCLSLVGLAWTLKTSNNAVKLDVRVDGVRFKLSDAWSVTDGLKVSKVEGLRLSEANIPGFGGMPIREFLLTDVDGRIRKLTISKGASVELEFRPDGIDLFIRGGMISGEILIASAEMLWVDPDGHKNRQKLTGVKGMPPEFLRFKGKNSGNEIPIRIDLDTSESWKSTGLIVSGLEFSREDPPASGIWVSTVLKAKGNFFDVN